MLMQKLLRQAGLSEPDGALLIQVASDLPILADLSRADLTVLCLGSGKQRPIRLAHASPHSSSPLYDDLAMGEDSEPAAPEVEVRRAFDGAISSRSVITKTIRGATVARQLYAVRGADGGIIAVLVKDAYWLAYERHRRRSRSFQEALQALIMMVLCGELAEADRLDPFGEHDGIVYVGPDRRIHYMSGIASELFRQLGYRDNLVGRRVSELETEDSHLVSRALAERQCVQIRTEEGGLVWIRQALPVFRVIDYRPMIQQLAARFQRSSIAAHRDGVLILVHDATEALKAQRELESKMALLREVHHRVKNNLQIVASILRMQARRVETAEAKSVLQESVGRILSVAVIHEFLSNNAKGTINLLDVARRIVAQVQQGLIDPSKQISLRVQGPDIWLPSERATQCALVINELVHNAIEHGMAHREQGTVQVRLVDRGEGVTIVVADDGEGLPANFDLKVDSNLGLRLVRNMVERDLCGSFRIDGEYGTQVTVVFDKQI